MISSNLFLHTDQLLGILALSKHPYSIFTTAHFIIQTANESMLRIWNADKKIIGSPLEKAVPGLADSPFLQLLREAWKSGASSRAQRVEVEVYTGTGGTKTYFDVDCQVLKKDNGEIYGVLQTAVEVSIAEMAGSGVMAEERESRAKLQDAHDEDMIHIRDDKKDVELERDRVKRFFMQAPAGICVLDGPDLVFELVNDQYQQFFPGRHLIGKPVFDAIPELKGSHIESILARVYRSGETYEGKELLVPLSDPVDGSLSDRYFNFIYQARRSTENKIDGILVFVIEVTDTVLNRKRIEESELALRSMVMTSHYGLMILRGKNYTIEIVNQQIANLWQRSLSDITEKDLLDVLPEIKDQPFPDLLDSVYETGKSYGQEEEVLYIDSKEGVVEKFINFYYDPMKDASGDVCGIIVACEDITEKVRDRNLLKESYHKQQNLNRQLFAANEELGAVNEEMVATNEELISTNEKLIKAQKSLQRMIYDFTESENRIRTIVANAPFPIGVYEGREMRIVLANQAIIEVWGKGNEVLGKRYAELLPELENQQVFEQLDQVFTTGVPFHIRNQPLELEVHGEKKIFYFSYSFTPLFNQSGEVYGVMNTASDVTDLVLTNQKIEQNEQNLNNLILQSPVAMCLLLGPQHVIKLANPLMLEIWGKPESEVLHIPVFEALPDAREQGLEQIMDDVYYKGETFRANEMPVNLIRNGKQDTVYQNFVYEPYYDSKGAVAGVIAITINVTEQVLARKRIEQNEAELLEIKKQLEAELEAGKEIQRQKDGFIGIASHELKTPLTSLSAIVQVANRKLKDSEDSFLTSAMEKADIQIKRMRSLISGFLNISRFESGNMVIEKQQFDIEQLIREVIDEINITYSTHTVRFTGQGGGQVEADRDKINSVLSNLLSNAIKYSPKGKEVDIDCQFVDHHVNIRVLDQGIGIKQEEQDRIFDRYFRVENSHTQQISGFGIGLYLSAEIVRRHGGEIWVESEPGQGSCFCFKLPVAAKTLDSGIIV